MNKGKLLIQAIKDKGLTVNKVELTAGIQTGTLRRWSENEPKSFQMEKDITNAIEKLCDEVQPGTER